MIFQDPRAHIDPLYRTGDHLVEGLRAQERTTKESAKSKALVLLANVGIDDPERVFRAYPAEVSGGMLQRVMIAGALTGDPELVIADEPTTALDVTTQAEIVALLARLCREHARASLFITHDLDLAASLCDRVLVMYAGRIVEENRSDRFFSGPLHPYSARLLRARPMIENRSRSLAVIPGRPVSAVDSPDGCPFHPRCAYATHECQTWTPVLTSIDGGWSGCRRVMRSDRSSAMRSQMPERSGPILEVEGLSKTFNTSFGVVHRQSHSVDAVRAVSFSLTRGGSLGIVGESGSGKTTVARILMGLEPPTEGQIRLDGVVVEKPANAMRAARERGRCRWSSKTRTDLSIQDNT